MRLTIIAVLSVLEVCRAYSPAANPPMLTHASMDVGNIISIVIPESPDENINIEQLTSEFRQQLERIKKQSRASKVEHGLVTLKRVLPEMSREEKRKTLPLIRRVLHGRRLTNSGSIKNWTREASPLEQMREGRQLAGVSRSSVNPEEGRIYRDYEEVGNRESIRIDPSIAQDNYRRISDGTYVNNREEEAREDAIDRNERIRHEESIRREESGNRENRVIFPEEDPSKIRRSESPQEWTKRNFEDQSRSETGIYPETSTVEYSYKSDRSVRQKQPGYEIHQNDGYDKMAVGPDYRAAMMEDPNVDSTKLDQRPMSRDPSSKQNGADDLKRSLKDSRAFETSNLPSYVDYSKEHDINEAAKPNCDIVKANGSGLSSELSKDRETNEEMSFGKQHREALILDRESYRPSSRTIQEPRESYGNSNLGGFKNIRTEDAGDVSTRDNDHNHGEEFRGRSLINSSPRGHANRWNGPDLNEKRSVVSSNGVKIPVNVYEMYGEKDIDPGFDRVVRNQDSLLAYLNNESKVEATRLQKNR